MRRPLAKNPPAPSRTRRPTVRKSFLRDFVGGATSTAGTSVTVTVAVGMSGSWNGRYGGGGRDGGGGWARGGLPVWQGLPAQRAQPVRLAPPVLRDRQRTGLWSTRSRPRRRTG